MFIHYSDILYDLDRYQLTQIILLFFQVEKKPEESRK